MTGRRQVHAPFSPGQVASLNACQESEYVHPYTCGGEACPSRTWDTESLPLAADRDGLHCIEPGCEYRQTWAHAWTADWSWRRRERRAARAAGWRARLDAWRIRRDLRKLTGQRPR